MGATSGVPRELCKRRQRVVGEACNNRTKVLELKVRATEGSARRPGPLGVAPCTHTAGGGSSTALSQKGKRGSATVLTGAEEPRPEPRALWHQ